MRIHRLFVILLLLIASWGESLAQEAKQGLGAPVFEPLPAGAIKPTGWLNAQLQAQAAGLSSNLDEFWPDIKDSAWIGGKAEGWERVPYWLDGLVPLAWQLDDARLQAKCRKYIDYILEHQHEDGWLGPVGNTQKHKPYDVWPLFPLFKALTQYQELTADPRVVPALLKAARKMDQVITREPLYSWAKMRAADWAISLYWLHEKTGGMEPWLLDLSRKAFAQSHDWPAQWEPFRFTKKTSGKFDLDTHGVNTAMALKYGPVRWRVSGNPADRTILDVALAGLDRHHGQATGIFTCDEHLAGLSPSQGTELCTVVEAMYSLALAGGITGEVRYFDRLERISYNALPATFKKDMTAHQYDQQANQVQCIRAGEHPWVSNGPDANLYGLEPNFGCCTANLHQGWPKLVAHMWMKTADAGLAACVYGPGIVETRIKGEPVRVEIVTEYPFRESVEIKVTTERDMVFPITLRAPGWTKGVMTVEGTPGAEGSKLEFSGGAMARAIIGPWKAGTTRLALRIPAGIESRQGENQAVSLHRGPLVFALPIEPRWKKILDRPGHDLDDWEVQPASPWNYALVLDSAAITALEPEKRPLGPITFEPVHAPLVLTLPARRLPAWGMEKGAAASPPRSPVTSDQALETIRLVPYGCTDLRITEFPWIRAE